MPDTELVTTETPRSEIVRLQIMQLGTQIHRSFIVLGHLLKESRDNDFHHAWGFSRFGQWVEEASGLDMSERTAYDFIKVIEGAERMGLSDESLSQVQYSALKEIFSLPADTDPAHTMELFEQAKSMKAKDVKAIVDTLKNDSYVYHTIKNPIDVETNVYQPALERMRREHGLTMGSEGQEQDITDSKAIELICVEYNNSLEQNDDDTIDAEFTDIGDHVRELYIGLPGDIPSTEEA